MLISFVVIAELPSLLEKDEINLLHKLNSDDGDNYLERCTSREASQQMTKSLLTVVAASLNSYLHFWCVHYFSQWHDFCTAVETTAEKERCNIPLRPVTRAFSSQNIL